MNATLEPPVQAAPNIRRELDADHVCVLTFDRPGSSANLFDAQTLSELDRHLAWIAASGAAGVVLQSAKPSIFIAGADLRALMDAAKRNALPPIIELGQSVFTRLASLPMPTVAAIHGACAGGGLEVALACDYRIATPDAATKIGLPETQLGILPGWGGSARLPRLIGLPAALNVILGGKLHAARQAFKIGIVDALAPRERLLELARKKIRSGKPHRASHFLTNNRLAAAAIAAGVRRVVLKKTRGHYPAQIAALETIANGVSLPLEKALALEREAVVRLASTETCRNLVNLFFQRERARKGPPGEAVQVAVIGAGVMGSAIAQWVSSRGSPVLLRDIDAERVGKGMANAARLYDAGVRRHTFTALEARDGLDRISPIVDEAPLKRARLVIEAAVEKMAVKKQVFARLEELCDRDAILATNTSALSVSALASGLAAPGRVAGLHFFNPVHRMQLVEVIVGVQTEPEVVQHLAAFARRIGKLPVVVKDSPGFLVNRILIPYLMEAGTLFEEGASVTEIDNAMLDFGMPMGPLRLLDEVGLDIATDVAETLGSPSRALAAMRDAGLLGRKSGRGFYLYVQPREKPNADLAPFRRGRENPSRDALRERMVLPMVNEAARCLEEKVVATADDVDFGMVMGTGFAPFRGGPLRYADYAGIASLVSRMKEPCELLKTMAAEGRKFYEDPD